MLRLQVTTTHAITYKRVIAGNGEHQKRFVLLHVERSLRPPLLSKWRSVGVARAMNDEANGGAGGFAGQSWDPGSEMEVPFEQRPDPLRFMLSAGIGTLFMVSLIVLRIYLGWSYVGDRLLSAVIPYDGQMWVKPPEVSARDRLLGSYKVKPVIKLLKQTLVGTGVLLVTAASLFIFASPVEDFLLSTSKVKPNLRKEKLLRLPDEVRKDDDLAAAAAEAADGRPVYCRDGFY